jgi:hypothetical protein
LTHEPAFRTASTLDEELRRPLRCDTPRAGQSSSVTASSSAETPKEIGKLMDLCEEGRPGTFRVVATAWRA